MKSARLVIVPEVNSTLGKFTQGKEYEVVRLVTGRDYVRVYYVGDLGREDYTHFDLGCISGGNLRNGSLSMYRTWQAKIIEPEQPISELDQIISTAQHYAKETAERAIADALLPGGQIHAAFRSGGYVGSLSEFYGEVPAVIAPMKILVAPTEDTALSSSEVLEVLRDILRVPEGENIITHARAVRAMADALIGIANQ